VVASSFSWDASKWLQNSLPPYTPTVLTCLLTWHANVTLTSGWRHPGHAYCACWYHYYVMLTSSLSGSAMWVGSTGIRVGSAHPGEEDAWADALPESAVMSDVWFWLHFHQWLRLFLLYTVVWSKHNFDNFHFWEKIKHPFKPCALIPIVGGFRLPHARTGGVLIVAQRRVKHTDTIFYVVRQNRLHPRESPYY